MEEREEFEAWLRENAEHRVFFEKIERAWYTGKYVARWKNVGGECRMESSGTQEGTEAKASFQERIGWSVAASVAVLIGITWLVGSWEEEIPSSVVAQSPVVKPGEAKARLVLSSGFEVELGCTNRRYDP